MAVISIASAKGGCSKTTLAVLLGADLALGHGYRVVVLDSDMNQHASAFGKKADIPGFAVKATLLRTTSSRNSVMLKPRATRW
jgi:chromosome partitioning protein